MLSSSRIVLVIVIFCCCFFSALSFSNTNNNYCSENIFACSWKRTPFMTSMIGGTGLRSSSSNDEDSTYADIDKDVYFDFPTARVQNIEFEQNCHKPLGCTAEECLDVLESESDAKHVFVSKIVKGGNAALAGIQLGDVIVGVSSIFGDELENVYGVGLDRVKSLVGGRDKDKSLVLRVARGTDVMSRHETALVDLCTLPDNLRDPASEKCIDALFNEGYAMPDDDVECSLENDDDSECMVDTLYNIWGEEDDYGIEKEEEVPKELPKKKKVYPWASRSSPSGTYVRNPKTGKLENIDA